MYFKSRNHILLLRKSPFIFKKKKNTICSVFEWGENEGQWHCQKHHLDWSRWGVAAGWEGIYRGWVFIVCGMILCVSYTAFRSTTVKCLAPQEPTPFFVSVLTPPGGGGEVAFSPIRVRSIFLRFWANPKILAGGGSPGAKTSHSLGKKEQSVTPSGRGSPPLSNCMPQNCRGCHANNRMAGRGR